MTCYYCGKQLLIVNPSIDYKRRKDRDGFHKLHRECATKWDNEGKR